jgi:transcriptional repressor NrdR
VIKKDERREEFDRIKLLTGIRKACEKQPLPTGTADKLADDIEAALYRLDKAEIPSTIIGDIVMGRLKSLDYIAYIRFASVYREFTDITALKQEVDTLVGNRTGTPHPTSQLSLLPNDKSGERDKGYREARIKVRLKQNNSKNSTASLTSNTKTGDRK